jgi:phosphoglycolate phosphatase-like HAD superfamily hydrolase
MDRTDPAEAISSGPGDAGLPASASGAPGASGAPCTTGAPDVSGAAGASGAAGQTGADRGAQAWSAQGGLAPSTRARWQQRARRTAYQGLLAARKPARQARLLPGFLIVGAERCGTTSLFHVLRQHPAVFSAAMPKKELHYFDQDYGRGLGWYQSHFPLTARARPTARRAGLDPVAFEASPYYMFHPLAPARIHRDLPGVKLIALVRDPVERAYSAHANHVGHGLETEPFERALELEDGRLAGEAERLAADPGYRSYNHRHYSYRTRGYYADQLDHLERIFGRDRIHVIDSGDFFTAPSQVYDQVLDFLGLARRGQPAFTPQNARPRSPMPASLRAALEEHYRPHDERLARWLGRPPSWRR